MKGASTESAEKHSMNEYFPVLPRGKTYLFTTEKRFAFPRPFLFSCTRFSIAARELRAPHNHTLGLTQVSGGRRA